MKTAANPIEYKQENKTFKATATKTAEAPNWYSNLIEVAEFNRYGLMVMFILVTCCMGGVGFWAMGHDFNVPTLVLLVSCTLMPLVLMLAIAPMRYILPVVAASFLTSTTITLIYLLS